MPAPERPLRDLSIPLRTEGDQEYPSLIGTVLLTVVGVSLTLVTLGVMFSPDSNNIPGSLIVTLVFVWLALWVDACAVSRWRKLTSASK